MNIEDLKLVRIISWERACMDNGVTKRKTSRITKTALDYETVAIEQNTVGQILEELEYNTPSDVLDKLRARTYFGYEFGTSAEDILNQINEMKSDLSYYIRYAHGKRLIESWNDFKYLQKIALKLKIDKRSITLKDIYYSLP